MELLINYSEKIENINLISLEDNLNKINKFGSEILKFHKSNPLSLSFVDLETIKDLNRKYRSKDKATDVLSWGYIADNMLEHELAGDIYISIDIARKQALDKGHSLEYEILFLFSHGFLHVFGYDHQTDEEERVMNELQNEILEKAGVQPFR